MQKPGPDVTRPLQPQADATTIVFEDHRFCAGKLLDACVMAAPHRHTQLEINHVLSGSITYWFDGRTAHLRAGDTAFFWGMVPHRTTDVPAGTRFVVLYVPAALLMGLHLGDSLRNALFAGALARARRTFSTDPAQFLRWREDLLAEDSGLEAIVRDELGARLRRIDRDGWDDLTAATIAATRPTITSAVNSDHVQAMLRFIGERSTDPIDVETVARAANLTPTYAMTLFKRSVGTTINEAIVRTRLDMAQALLVSSDDDIAGIAFSSGFGSLSRFYEAFHARFGLSPAKFRRHHRPGARTAA